MDRDEERIERNLSHLLTRQRRRTERATCPDEESLASYLVGFLTEDAKRGLEAHLADCSFCLEDLVSAHKAAQDNESDKVPQQLVDRAMSLVPPIQGRQNFLDLVVRLVKGSLELVSSSGRLILATAPAGIRGRPEPSETSILQIEKEMGKFNVTVEVERVGTNLCQVVVKVKEKDGKLAEGIRLSLFSGGREQASYLTRQGEVVFDRIAPGEYNLAVSDSGVPVGTIRLRMEEESS